MEIFVIVWFVLFGSSASDLYPSAPPDVECVGVACDADHDNTAPAGAAPNAPDAPDVPDSPDDEPDDEPDGKPGHGHGDKNHDHKGPPGQEKK